MLLFFFFIPQTPSALPGAEDLLLNGSWGSQPERAEEENLGTELTVLFITSNT